MGEHLEQLQQGGEDKRKEGESTGSALAFFPPPSPRRQEENANSVLSLLFPPYAFLFACCFAAVLALPFFLCALSFSFISLLPSRDPTTAEMHSNRVAAEADATTIPPPFLLFHPPPPSLFPSLLLGNIYQCFTRSKQKV